MPLYYFDFRDNGVLLPDVDGLELDGIDTVRAEATGAVLQRARDLLPGAVKRELTVEVRDQTGSHVLEARLGFEVIG